jgi:hypothetical protein
MTARTGDGLGPAIPRIDARELSANAVARVERICARFEIELTDDEFNNACDVLIIKLALKRARKALAVRGKWIRGAMDPTRTEKYLRRLEPVKPEGLIL